MKITRISVFQVDLPLHEGSYRWSGGKSVEVFDSTVVRIDTDEGVAGHGEVCPLGPVYLPSYARGARAGLEELAPQLVGEDPTQIERLNRTMDRALKGHPYVKSAIDMAAWDVLGQATGMPVCELLGGRYGDDFVLYRAISQDIPDAMAASVAGYREEGYHRFQLKVGGDPDVDIERVHACAAVLASGDKLIADANTGWLRHEAMRVAAAVRDVDVYIEQPCASYEECLSVRRHTDRPFVLDESIDGIDALLRVFYDNIHALRGLSLEVDTDEIVTLIGANGAGKTTTLNAICSILAPAEGEVRFEGEVLTYVAPHDVVGRGIVQIPEGRRIFGRLTVGENLRMGAFLRTDKQKIRQSEEHVLTMFPALRERIGQVAGTLSGGEQQMLAMARGLMSKPRVLLLDEPSMGLAPMLVETIFEAVLAIRKEGVPVLLVEQNAFMALQIADRGYVMETGEIVLEGTGRELLENDEVQRAYLG